MKNKLHLVNDTSVDGHNLEQRKRGLKSRMNSLLESIVFDSEFESIIYDEKNNTIKSKQRCSLDSNTDNSSIHHVRFNSKRDRCINNRTEINASTIDENAIITPNENQVFVNNNYNKINVICLNENKLNFSPQKNEIVELIVNPIDLK